jgi:iron complex transport system substrate-binding protein
MKNRKEYSDMKRSIAGFILAVMPVLCAGACYGATPSGGELKSITDMCGNRIVTPLIPKRVVSLHCVTPDRIITVGRADSLVLMDKQSPWAYKLFPELRNVRTDRTGKLEQMREVKPDLIMYTTGMFKGKGDELRAAGFNAACAFSADRRPRSVDDFVADFKRQIRFFGELMGPDARVRAERYCAYFDRKIKAIRAITSKLDAKERPSVYYGWKGGKAFSSQGFGSTMHWNTEIAGGTYLPMAQDDNFAKLDRKLALSWDPDLILVSRGNVLVDDLKNDPDWATKKAVRNGNVYATPVGIYSWDNAGGETVLMIIQLAKLLHPELFRDWDMKREMREFYAQVYGKKITDQDAQRILDNLPPL